MEFVKILVLIVCSIQNIQGFFDPYQFQNIDVVTSGKYCGTSGCSTSSSEPIDPITHHDGK